MAHLAQAGETTLSGGFLLRKIKDSTDAEAPTCVGDDVILVALRSSPLTGPWVQTRTFPLGPNTAGAKFTTHMPANMLPELVPTAASSLSLEIVTPKVVRAAKRVEVPPTITQA